MNFSKTDLQKIQMPPKKKDKELQSKELKSNSKNAIIPKPIQTWYDILVANDTFSSKQTLIQNEVKAIAEIQKWVETLSQSPEMVIALQNLT